MKEIDQEKIDKMWKDVEAECLKLRILMGGKTGVGKSSVINAIVGDEVSKVAQDGRPCTKVNQDIAWSTDAGDLIVTDVPGFGEANSPNIDSLDYENNIRELAKKSHIFLLILNCNDKALELEEKFVKKWVEHEELRSMPMLIVINQIDKMKPTREWNPNELNLENPKTQKELGIKSYIDYVSSIPAFSKFGYGKNLIPISSGEFLGDTTYGIEKLKDAISRSIPDILTLIIDRESKSREEKARSIMNYYSMSAAAVAVQPIPVIDSFLIAPIQISMIIHIGKIHSIKVTKSIAGGLLSSIGLSFIGNSIFLNIVSIFPGVKQFLGPAIAYSLTFTMGLIVNELFSSGNLNPSKDDIKNLAKKFKSETKAAKDRYEKEKK